MPESSPSSSPSSASLAAIIGLRLFFLLLVITLLISRPYSNLKKLFLSSHGRSHRLVGAAHLTWLLVGVAFLVVPPSSDDDHAVWPMKCLFYDIILGILGISATLTAAHDFPHRRVTNNNNNTNKKIGSFESGTLSRSAIVTQGEMMEHSFYQGLNLWQALYLHGITWVCASSASSSLLSRMAMLWLVTLPWAFRRRYFPVNSFSANWTTAPLAKKKRDSPSNESNKTIKVGTEKNKANHHNNITTINRMYQVKKWQYIFYKHVILHGLNISMTFPPHMNNNEKQLQPLPLTQEWRIFWLALNTSYVMEFFLQSLVKHRNGLYMKQRTMMYMNGLLMISSSLAAFGTGLLLLSFGSRQQQQQVKIMRGEAVIMSLLLNFVNRHHDVCNTMLVGCIMAVVCRNE